MNWISPTDQLPPKNTLVWIKRTQFGSENPIHLGMRNGRELSTNEDFSKDCFWMAARDLSQEQEDSSTFRLNILFSDMTVEAWSYINLPTYP